MFHVSVTVISRVLAKYKNQIEEYQQILNSIQFGLVLKSDAKDDADFSNQQARGLFMNETAESD